MSLNEIVAFVRGMTSLYVFSSAIATYLLYVDGYRIAQKESPIIKSLTSLIFWIGLVFGYLSISALAQAFNMIAHEILVLFTPFFFFPLGFALSRFRKESTIDRSEKDKKND